MLMVGDFYMLNSCGASCIKIAETLRDVDFLPMVSDPDVYRR